MKTVVVDQKVISPSKIICIGRNYVDHIKELGNEVPDDMVIFIKPNSAVSTVLHSFQAGSTDQESLHYEGELSFLFQQGKFTAVGFGLDLTKRGLQSKLKAKGLPWERAKAFNGSAVFSEFKSLTHFDDSLSLKLSINNKLTQEGGIELMMYKPAEILAEIQTFIELEDGDIVMTGTPKGVGIITKGDEFFAEVLIADKCLLSASWLAK